jgi:hypothetical protein
MSPAHRRPVAAAAFTAIVIAAGLVGAALRPAPAAAQQPSRPAQQLAAFDDLDEIVGFLQSIAAPRCQPSPITRRGCPDSAFELQEMVVTGAAARLSAAPATDAAPSVTNVQHAGVDEGGIVKLHGNHLVVLRRGRLFTVDIAGDRLAPVSAVDAFGPGIDPRGTWYDELLVTGSSVIVIGYSYQRGGTEIGIFEIDRRGRLEHRSTYQLRSNDYFSSRNYASRLVEGRLVFYAPLVLDLDRIDRRSMHDMLPGLRRWNAGGGTFVPIASASRIFRPARDMGARHRVALHTVTSCAIARGELDCEATGVFGPFGHSFYVSPHAVYVWLDDWQRTADSLRAPAMVYRMPLSGDAPAAIGVSGSPIDQFSFLESDDGHLNVVVSSGAGQWMWGAEQAHAALRLLRMPIASFGDGGADAHDSRYAPLPEMPTGRSIQNRFVGEHLLLGAGAGWHRPDSAAASALTVVRWRDGTTRTVRLDHPVDRLEPLGHGALVVGADRNDLHLSALALTRRPHIVDRFTLSGAAQGETRSHGFFYRADSHDSGVLGLPVRDGGRPGYEQLFAGSASIAFLRTDALRLQHIGSLEARAPRRNRDGCVASCADWYGNARPLFIGPRVFALLGYEIVEGSMRDGDIVETRRIDFQASYARVTSP